MKNAFTKLLWLIIFLGPFVFWFLIYKAWTLEYDANFAALILAFLFSLLVPFAIYRVGKTEKDKFNKWFYLILFSLLFGSPIAFIPLIFYVSIFQMSLETTGSTCNNGKCYDFEKRKNYFKAENILTRNSLTDSSYSFVAIIKRNNELLDLVKIHSGDTVKIDKKEISFLSKEEKDELLNY